MISAYLISLSFSCYLIAISRIASKLRRSPRPEVSLIGYEAGGLAITIYGASDDVGVRDNPLPLVRLDFRNNSGGKGLRGGSTVMGVGEDVLNRGFSDTLPNFPGDKESNTHFVFPRDTIMLGRTL